MQRRRAVLSLTLMAMGAALLSYGLFCHAGDVWPADTKGPTVSSVSGGVDLITLEPVATAAITAEPAMIREVAIGGLMRDTSGQLKKTYSGQAPKACPT